MTDDVPPRAPAIRAPRLSDFIAWGALPALALWAVAPIAYLALRAGAHHESLSGADSLFAADQLQYLAWIRSSGDHLLAANGFDLRAGGEVYLNPMFALSGLLWRAGIGIALSYLLWLPVAVGVLYVGFRQFIWHFVSGPTARAAALILALFFVTPADPIVGWTVGSNGLGVLSGELAPSGWLYGYLPIAISVGLLALFMLGIARILSPGAASARRWLTGWTAAAGLIIAWLHPWQGEIALLVIAALLVAGRFTRRYLPLLIPAVATALPLAYYLVLSRVDAAWKLAELQSSPVAPNVLLLFVALAPLLAFAALGLAGAGWRRAEPILWLWPLAALVVYFVSPGYRTHALEGAALPLVVLAVRGWQRLRLPAWLAIAAIAVCTIPGLVFNLKLFHQAATSNAQPLLLKHDETQALAYLARTPVPGGVLASLRIAAAVPAYTGRRTWVGHASWTPNYAGRAGAVSALFDGQLGGAAGRAFLRQVGARFLMADCESGFDPSWLGSLLVSERRFGCVAVYRLAVPNAAAPL